MPRNAVFETYAEYSNKMMVRWAMHQERQCLKKRGMQAHEEKMRLEKSRLGYVGAAAANRSNRKLLDGEDDGEAAPAGADENSDTKSVLHAAIDAERGTVFIVRLKSDSGGCKAKKKSFNVYRAHGHVRTFQPP